MIEKRNRSPRVSKRRAAYDVTPQRCFGVQESKLSNNYREEKFRLNGPYTSSVSRSVLSVCVRFIGGMLSRNLHLFMLLPVQFKG